MVVVLSCGTLVFQNRAQNEPGLDPGVPEWLVGTVVCIQKFVRDTASMADTIMTRISRRLGKIRKNISDLFRIAALHEGKTIATQIREILKLKFGPTRLRVEDYYWYNLANKEIYEDVDLATFGGNFMSLDLHKRLNNALWDAVVTDKLIMALVFSSTGIPHPKMYAAACQFTRNCGDY